MSNIIKGITQEDPITKKEPEVHVPGYGTIPLEMLKRHVQSLSKDFDTLIQQGAFLKAAYRSEQFYNALMALAKALPKPNNEGYSAGAVGGSGIGEEVEEGLKSSIAAGILAGMGMIGSAQGQAADLSNFSTNYLQQVVKGEHPRPMVNIDDAKFELQQREQGKSTPPQSSTAKSTSGGFSNEYLKSVIDGTHPRPMISIEKAKEILKQRGVQEHINTPGGMGQSYRKFKPKPAGLDEAYRSMFYTMPPSLKDRKKLRAQGQRVPLRTYSELAQMLGISFDQLNGLRQKFPEFPKPVTGVAGARHGAIKYFKPDEFQVWLDKHNIKELLGLKKEVGEEQTPMFTPEEKIVNANDPKSDGWRLYKMKPAGTKESAIMKGITK